jgi:hypothetical protein
MTQALALLPLLRRSCCNAAAGLAASTPRCPPSAQARALHPQRERLLLLPLLQMPLLRGLPPAGA